MALRIKPSSYVAKKVHKRKPAGLGPTVGQETGRNGLVMVARREPSGRLPRPANTGEVAGAGAAFGGTADAEFCIMIYRASPLERIELIRRGIPAEEAKRFFNSLGLGQGAALEALNLSAATVNKKAKAGTALSADESERVIGCARLVGQVEAMVLESGDPAGFDAAAWVARWLTEPLPAFGGVRPAALMDTMEGQALVSSALAKMQSGAYA